MGRDIGEKQSFVSVLCTFSYSISFLYRFAVLHSCINFFLFFSSLMHTIQTVLGREVAHTVRGTKTEKYPLILIINRVRRNTELLRVIHGWFFTSFY